MSRPQRCRRICCAPQFDSFSPEKTPESEAVTLTLDEYEVIRLVDLEKKTHSQCAAQMDISRSTVTEIYESAREKLARCIVYGQRLLISGGNYRVCEGNEQARCGQCWRQDTVITVKEKGDKNIMKIAVTYENGEIFQHFGHTEQFKVYEVETVHEVTTLTCYDAMREADVLCPTEMQGEHNYIELWRLAATRLGLTPSAIDSDLGYNALATVDTQHTIRQVIEAIALACGGNAVVSGNALYVRPITSTTDVTLTQWINQLEVASTPVEVTGVRVKKTFASDGQEHTYFFGAGGYVIELNDDNLWMGIEGPSGSITVAAEAVAKTVYEQLKNKPIYKFSGDLPADPRLDIFDKVIVKDINGREYPSIIMNYTFVFSGKTSIGNSVESSSSYNTSDSGPSGSSPSGGGGGGAIDVDSALSTTSTNPVQNKVITAALAGKAGTAAATQSAAGLMSAADKVKLDGLSGAGVTLTPMTAAEMQAIWDEN